MTHKDEKIQKNKDRKRRDQQLWEQMTVDVTPLPDRPGDPPRVRSQDDRDDLGDGLSKTVVRSERPVFNAKPVASRDRGLVGDSEVDRRTAQKLKRGDMAIEARLDLHGMTRVQAHGALEGFLRSSYGAGRRCVLVITGRGAPRHSGSAADDSSRGVLRRSVPEWLREDVFRDIVLKVEQARPQDGGEGAFYVLLRRKRS
ncbi:MAG: Smr/MutS family protein [Alphaproteobacteria bacterium]|nr:Smr/MutS family protein [Alphaproteobacteria bacterium]